MDKAEAEMMKPLSSTARLPSYHAFKPFQRIQPTTNNSGENQLKPEGKRRYNTLSRPSSASDFSSPLFIIGSTDKDNEENDDGAGGDVFGTNLLSAECQRIILTACRKTPVEIFVNGHEEGDEDFLLEKEYSESEGDELPFKRSRSQIINDAKLLQITERPFLNFDKMRASTREVYQI
uniref:Protein TSSC4 n=1 Tax=Rhabditophanes sp. KR3021 TaxID=114890 RepID=A0AC35TUM5_9BILA